MQTLGDLLVCVCGWGRGAWGGKKWAAGRNYILYQIETYHGCRKRYTVLECVM